MMLALSLASCSPPAPEPATPGPFEEAPARPGEESVSGILSTEPGAQLAGVFGTVTRVTDDWWGLVPDADPGTRFAPDSLPPELHEDGLPVVFDGIVGEVPRGARLWGIPLQLTSAKARSASNSQPLPE